MLNLLMNSSESRKDANVAYITGYSPSFCIAILDNDSGKKCMFVIPFEIKDYPLIKCFAFDKKTFTSTIKSYFKVRRIRDIAINKEAISINTFRKIRKILPARYSDNSSAFNARRMIKNSIELRNISRACRITCDIFEELLSDLRKNKKSKNLNEEYISLFLKEAALRRNSDLAFEPVVASGANAGKPHHKPGKAKLRGFTIIDFGVKYNGYCSDMTRTLYFGKPSKKEVEKYNLVLGLYERSVKMLRPGVALKDVDASARKHLGKRLTHSLGHGVGVEIHERPSISPSSKDLLKNGMIFAIEPGSYDSSSGIRIEDTIAFIKGKAKPLTTTKKELLCF